MANVAVNDLVRTVVYCRLGSQNGLNVRHWVVDVVDGADITYQELADAFSNFQSIPYRQVLSDEAEYLGVSVQRVTTPVQVPVISTAGAGNGNVTGDALPSQCTGLISLRADAANRHGRGRMYVPFPSEADSDAMGLPDASYIARLTTLASHFAGTQTFGVLLGSVQMTPVVAPSPAGGIARLTSAVVRHAWATQRRRSAINRGDAFPPVA